MTDISMESRGLRSGDLRKNEKGLQPDAIGSSPFKALQSDNERKQRYRGFHYATDRENAHKYIPM